MQQLKRDLYSLHIFEIRTTHFDYIFYRHHIMLVYCFTVWTTNDPSLVCHRIIPSQGLRLHKLVVHQSMNSLHRVRQDVRHMRAIVWPFQWQPMSEVVLFKSTLLMIFAFEYRIQIVLPLNDPMKAIPVEFELNPYV